ncbi:MAG TPA: hypothetical protein VG167_18885 [Verrucomicrobiae bacterium]|nr:hypothetical protein [Verrucomicrobiae bacterium]
MKLALLLLLLIPLGASAAFSMVTLIWTHAPGPYSYNVYGTTNLTLPMRQWPLLTNVTDLEVTLPVSARAQFFTVTCLDTNTGLESGYATR